MKYAKSNGFRMLPSYYDAIRNLPDGERLKIYDAILDRGFGNRVEPLPPSLSSVYVLIQPTLERSVRYFEKQKEIAKKPRKKPDAAKLSLDSESEGDSESDSEGESEKEKQTAPPAAKRFDPPSLEEISAYCRERGNRVDAAKFADYYAARGWRVGSGTMKDWRAAVRIWERRDDTNGRKVAPDGNVPQKSPARDFGIRYDNPGAFDTGGKGADL